MAQIGAIGANVTFKAAQGTNNPIGATTPQTSVQPQTTQQAPEEEKLILGKFTKKQALIGAAAAAGITAAVVGGILLHKSNPIRQVQNLADEADALAKEAEEFKQAGKESAVEVRKIFREAKKNKWQDLTDGDKIVGKFEFTEGNKYPSKFTQFSADSGEVTRITTIDYIDNKASKMTLDEFIEDSQSRFVIDMQGDKRTFKYAAKDFNELEDGAFEAEKLFAYSDDIDIDFAKGFKGSIEDGNWSADEAYDLIDNYITVRKNTDNGKFAKEMYCMKKGEDGKAGLECYHKNLGTEQAKSYVVKDGKLKEMTEEDFLNLLSRN